MQIRYRDRIESDDLSTINTLSHARLDDVSSLSAVAELIQHCEQEHKTFFLCTLDDVNQCCYTSMHASHSDLLSVDADYEDEPAYDLARLRHVAALLNSEEGQIGWDTLHHSRSDGDIAALMKANADPDIILDDVVYLQRVPVERADLLIAGLPNGYFSCDWSTLQNYAVIRRFSAQYSYRFFGLGASWLGFWRESPLSGAQAQSVIEDLKHLYGGENAVQEWDALAGILTHSRFLLLGYTENFAESLE